MARTRVKICCIGSEEEAGMAISDGADAIGLVGRMPSGPGVIDDAAISRISASVPPPVGTFLLTSETSAEGIVSHWKRTGTGAIQIVDSIREDEYASIRTELPWVKLVQVIHVEDSTAVDRALRISVYVDAILLDSGNPTAATKILGGTGKTHDWEISGEIVKECGVRVFLAGGITPENVRRAIEFVRPYGVDVCTGVRTGGRLDRVKLQALFREIEKTVGV